MPDNWRARQYGACGGNGIHGDVRFSNRPFGSSAFRLSTTAVSMLRHACGFKLTSDGVDTRALQAYLGHKSIQHTVRYTELAPTRFKGFWRD